MTLRNEHLDTFFKLRIFQYLFLLGNTPSHYWDETDLGMHDGTLTFQIIFQVFEHEHPHSFLACFS